jgi:hypothetical protein
LSGHFQATSERFAHAEGPLLILQYTGVQSLGRREIEELSHASPDRQSLLPSMLANANVPMRLLSIRMAAA